MKPEKPITRKEMYLDVATGGSTELPSPVTREEKYLAKIAGESVDIPTPVTRYEMLLAAVAGESYTPTPVTRLEIYLAKAAGQDVEIPQPVTREEMYWFDYCGGTPTPPEREYTGAVPVTFIADGTPLLDYLISGNEEHSGTPTPDTPVMPQGTGERTGNLLHEFYAASGEISGNSYTITKNSIETHNDGSVLGAWYVLAEFKRYGNYANYTPIDEKHSFKIPAGTYTFSANENIHSGNNGLCLIVGQLGQTVAGATRGAKNIGVGQTFTVDADSYVCPVLEIRYDSRVDEYILANPMLNSGSTPLPYEPYGYKIPISSGGVTTNVYLGEVETTRRIKKLVLTGEESWSENTSGTNTFRGTMPLSENNMNYTPGFCTHVEYVTTGVSRDMELVGCLNSNIYLRLSRAIVNTLADFKTYLQQQYAAGTPVTVWYVLATEETAVVNEPLMRIGDYTDTLSMEQAGVQIPTANGSTTLDVDTTVKPSEIYIKYRGEAVATLSMLSAEVSSPEATEEVNPEETEEEENGSEDISLQHEFEAIE